MSSLDQIQAQFQFLSSLPPPLGQAAALVAPFQLLASVASAGFGSSVPVKLQARILFFGQPLPDVPVSLTLDDAPLASNVRTDPSGSVPFTVNLTTPGTHSIKVFAGPAVPENPAVAEVMVTVASVGINSNVPASVAGDGQTFSAPTNLLFPFYAGGPSSYTLTFPQTVGNNVLTSPSSPTYQVTGSDVVNLVYTAIQQVGGGGGGLGGGGGGLGGGGGGVLGGNLQASVQVVRGSVYNRRRDVYTVGTPYAGATVLFQVVQINANPQPPASIVQPAVLAPDGVTGVTDANGNFTLMGISDNQGTINGYYATSSGAVTCCQPQPYYNLYQVTITLPDGTVHGPYQYVDPNSTGKRVIDVDLGIIS